MKFLDSNNRHATMDGESLAGLNPTQRIAGYYGMVKAGIGYPVPNGQLGKHVDNVLD